MNLPEAKNLIEALSKAEAIRETWSAGDASCMIQDGFVLVGICQTPEDEHPFMYSLIWPRPLSEANSRIREVWRF